MSEGTLGGLGAGCCVEWISREGRGEEGWGKSGARAATRESTLSSCRGDGQCLPGGVRGSFLWLQRHVLWS